MTDPFANGDFTIGPEYTPAPETLVQPGVPAGKVHAFVMESRDSRIYPGIRRLENEVTRRRDRLRDRTHRLLSFRGRLLRTGNHPAVALGHELSQWDLSDPARSKGISDAAL